MPTLAEIKAYFEANDQPTQSQFAEAIDKLAEGSNRGELGAHPSPSDTDYRPKDFYKLTTDGGIYQLGSDLTPSLMFNPESTLALATAAAGAATAAQAAADTNAADIATNVTNIAQNAADVLVRRKFRPNIASLQATAGVDGEAVSVLGYTTVGDAGEPWDMIYRATGRPATENGFQIFGPGADDWWEAADKRIANVRRFGCKGDGVTEESAIIQAVFDIAPGLGASIYFPPGTYVIYDFIEMADGFTADGQTLHMYGDGRGISVIKEADGATAAEGRFKKMFRFYYGLNSGNAFPYAECNVRIEKLTIDKNGLSNGDPPARFDWEQSHAIAFEGGAEIDLADIKITECGFKDKTGAFIAFPSSPTSISGLTLRDLTFEPLTQARKDALGERGDVELGVNCTVSLMDNVTAEYVQTEPVLAASETIQRNIRVVNSTIGVLQITEGLTSVKKFSKLYVNNCSVWRRLDMRRITAVVSSSEIKVANEFMNCGQGSKIVDSTILMEYDSDADNVLGAYIGFTQSGDDAWMDFDNCDFVIDSETVAVNATGFAVRGSTLGANVRLTECRFDERLYGSVDGYRYGDFEVIDCDLAGHTYAVQIGAFSTFTASMKVRDNDFSRVTGNWVRVVNNNDLWDLEVQGTYDAESFSFTRTGSTGDLLQRWKVRPRLIGTGPPTTGIRQVGDRVYPEISIEDSTAYWVCTANGTPGTWQRRSVSLSLTATTAQLEDIADPINTTDPYAGKEVFNTTTGRPVYKTGSAAGDVWNDAVGALAHTPV